MLVVVPCLAWSVRAFDVVGSLACARVLALFSMSRSGTVLFLDNPSTQQQTPTQFQAQAQTQPQSRARPQMFLAHEWTAHTRVITVDGAAVFSLQQSLGPEWMFGDLDETVRSRTAALLLLHFAYDCEDRMASEQVISNDLELQHARAPGPWHSIMMDNLKAFDKMVVASKADEMRTLAEAWATGDPAQLRYACASSCVYVTDLVRVHVQGRVRCFGGGPGTGIA